MARPKIKLGEHLVELRRTLATLRRIKEATGLSSTEWGEQVEKGQVDEGEAVTVALWAMIAHDENVGGLSIDELAPLVELDRIEEIAEAINAASSGPGPSRPARGKKARPPRKN